MRRAVSVFLALLAVGGCGKVEPPKPPLTETIAILPFDNESNELNAPEILQKYVYLALLNSPYRPLDIKVVNDKLASVGIVDGGQLAAVDPRKVGEDLGVHALMFGNVETFGYANVGFYASRKVTLELKLVDVKTGDVLWESAGTGANRQFAVDPEKAKAIFAEGLARQTVEKVAKAPLDDESRLATANALRSLPGYFFNGFAKDPDLSKTEAVGRKAVLDAIRK